MSDRFEVAAKKMTSWLMNPVEVDYSDPAGEAHARYKQADDMQKLVTAALRQAFNEGVDRSIEIATHCSGHGTACSHGQEIANAIRKERIRS